MASRVKWGLVYVAFMTELGMALGMLYPEPGIRVITWMAAHHLLYLPR